MVSWRGWGHPRAGGAEAYAQRVLAGLAARGHEVSWLCEVPAPGEVEGVRLLPGGGGLGLYPRAMAYLRRHGGRYDVVVDHVNVVGFLAPLLAPVPHLALIHQLAREVWRYEVPPPAAWLGPPAELCLLRAYRRSPFVTVSRTTLRQLRALGWRGPGFLAYNGVEPRGPFPKAPRPTVAFLGRWGARAKRLDHALAAFARVRQALPEAELWVVGRGRPDRRPPPGVSFFPDVSDGERDALLGASWVLVATSVREGWGRMVLEAAAVGTPSLAYRVPGLAEACRALGGELVPPDPVALGARLTACLRDPEGLVRWGREAQARARRFSWERTVDVWEEALQAARVLTPGR
jgi:glycosyltransferase involved in cell wall biosynthesis